MSDSFDWSKRYLKKFDKVIKKIIKRQDKYKDMSDDDLKKESLLLKEKMKNGSDEISLLIDSFALCREASKRVLNKEHYPCQIQAGIAMLDNRIAEMATGEGKTLAAILPAYFKALEGKGVHIITSNDYLAQRDYEEMGKVFEFLGISTGLVQSNTSHDDRKEAYGAEVTYCSSSQVCFDYLRDNMVVRNEDKVQRDLNFAIIDEVDSLLIDDAITPVIISDVQPTRSMWYFDAINLIRGLEDVTVYDDKEITNDLNQKYDFIINSKTNTVEMTDRLYYKISEKYNFNDYDELGRNMFFYVDKALTAKYAYHKDTDYMVIEDEIQLVDKNTNRTMHGRKLGDGLHQSIQAKEGLKLDAESRELATITFRNFFKLYNSVSGMTGTAMEVRKELATIYGLDVIRIPRNKPKIAKELPERIFKTKNAKHIAIVKEILNAYKNGRPVLVGTNTIEESEEIAGYLKEINLPVKVLNAKPENAKDEADIIANAGKKGAITIATNMAGRGTDIKLGEGVKELGGLLVIGAQRNISKRIDNQLKGRTGRQGDPGTFQFFSSLEDDIVLNVKGLEQLKKLPEEEITDPLLTNLLDKYQREIEGMHSAMRKSMYDRDDVLDTMRGQYYRERKQLLNSNNLKNDIIKMVGKAIETRLKKSLIGDKLETSRIDKDFERYFNLKQNERKHVDEVVKNICNAVDKLSSDDLIKLRTNFLKNADIEYSRVCEIVKQGIDGPMYWFLSEEEKRNKQLNSTADRYDEFCDYILDFMLDQFFAMTCKNEISLAQGLVHNSAQKSK